MAIQDYQITVEHCPGKENVIADAISRQTTQTLGSDNTGDKHNKAEERERERERERESSVSL